MVSTENGKAPRTERGTAPYSPERPRIARSYTGRGGGTGVGSPNRGYTAQTPPVRCHPDLLEVLEALAAAQGVRLTEVLREALVEYVDRHRAANPK